MVTARDIGSAQHLSEIISYADEACGLRFTIYAQQPAAGYLRKNLPAHIVNVCSADFFETEDLGVLAKKSHDIVRKVKPDLMLSGLSIPTSRGINESVIRVIKNKIPSFMLSDYWGGCYPHDEVRARHYLCMDDASATLASQENDVCAINVGPVKYERYARFDSAKSRKKNRQQYGVSDDYKVVGFFGQPLHTMSGYDKTVQLFGEAVNKLDSPIKIIYRPHPCESVENVKKTIDLINQAGSRPIVSSMNTIEEDLSICNVVCSAFSTSGYDACYLNYFSNMPFVVPINLLFSDDIKQYCFDRLRFNRSSYFNKKIAFNVYKENDLDEILSMAISDCGSEKIWKVCRSLNNPAGSAKKVIQYLKKHTEIFYSPRNRALL